MLLSIDFGEGGRGYTPDRSPRFLQSGEPPFEEVYQWTHQGLIPHVKVRCSLLTLTKAGVFAILNRGRRRKTTSRSALIMTSSISDSCGRIVRAFLVSPLNRKTFDSFFKTCYSHTVGYLRYLKAKGFQLPLEHRSDGDPFGNLAIDLLGIFLHSTKEKPFPIVFDYFNKVGVSDPNQADPDDIYHHFTVLLRGHIRRQLSRLKAQQDPQIDHLKRRFKEILIAPRFGSMQGSSGEECLFLTQHNHDLRRDNKLPIPYDELVQVVERTYLKSRSRTAWCLNIFELLNEAIEYQNIVKKHELLAAIISVNAKYIDADGLQPTGLPTAENALLVREVEEAIAQTLAWLGETVLSDFVRKGRINSDEAQKFKAASERYLSDLAHVGETDPIPQYFREVMPKSEHDRYLNDYKYIFETTINDAVEDFKERLKKKTTVLKYRDYFKDG